MKNICFLSLFCWPLLWASCHSHAENSSSETTSHHDEAGDTKTVSLTPAQMESIQIRFGSLEKKQLTAALRANGILKVPNQNRAAATALMGGVIQSILVQAGSYVRQGQTPATCTNQAFVTLQEDYLTVSANLNLAELEYKRQSELQAGNATALKNLQQAEAEVQKLKVRQASLRKQLELIGIPVGSISPDHLVSSVPIVSPIAGAISTIYVNIGTAIQSNDPICDLIDNSQLHLDLFVYEKDLKKLRVGQLIHFTLTNDPGTEYDAEIYSISNTFEPETKAVAVHAAVKGDKTGLMDGMSITALVSLENATVDAVPTEAIVNHDGQDFIFIETGALADKGQHEEKASMEEDHDAHGHSHSAADKDHQSVEQGVVFEIIPVRKGTTDVGYSEITPLADLPPGSRIVVNGAFFLLAKMTNQGEAHEH